MQTSPFQTTRWLPLGEVTSGLHPGYNLPRPEPEVGNTRKVVRASDVPDELGYVSAEHLLEARLPDAKAVDRALVEARDVILVARGSGFKVGIATRDLEGAVLAGNLVCARPLPEVLHPEVLAAFLATDAGRQAIMGMSRSASAGLMSLTASDLAKLPVPIPPLGVQAQLVAIVNANARYQQATRAALADRTALTLAAVSTLLEAK